MQQVLAVQQTFAEPQVVVMESARGAMEEHQMLAEQQLAQALWFLLETEAVRR